MACAWFLLPLCSQCVFFFSSFRRPFSCACVCARRKKRNEQRKGRREWEGEKHIELAHIQRKIFQPNKNKHFPMFTRMNFRSGFTSFFLFPDVEVIFCDNECFVFRFLFLVSFRSRIHVYDMHRRHHLHFALRFSRIMDISMRFLLTYNSSYSFGLI